MLELDVDLVVRAHAVLLAPLIRGRADGVIGSAGPALVLKLQSLVLSISVLLQSEQCLGYYFSCCSFWL